MYDEPVAVPIIDLLDSNMMSQYISAAREQYNQAVQEQKEFAKEFGDLYSPSSELNKAYYDQTKGRVNAGLNYLYQNGIDPLRSAEGRAYIAKIIRETPYEKIANWKSDAENMKLYNKAAASLAADGKYDKEYADWTLAQQGLPTMDKFDPYGDTRWTAISPVKYQNIDEFSKPYGDSIKPGLLTKQDVEALGHTYDSKNDYMGISNQQVSNAADKAVQAMKATPQGQFEIQRIKKQMVAQGLNPTDADAEKAFAGKIASGWGTKVGVQAMDANKYAYADYANKLADQLDAKKSARDLNNYIAKLNADRQDEITRKSLGLGNKGSGQNYETIFDVARQSPGQVTSTDIDNLRANGVTLADPSGTWNEVTNSQSQKDDNGNTQSENHKIQRITITDGNTVVRSGGFRAGQQPDRKVTINGKKKIIKHNVQTGLYKTPGRKIEAEVSSGPVYNEKLNRYYIKATVTAVNDNFSAGTVGQSIWVEVKPGYIGKAPNKAN